MPSCQAGEGRLKAVKYVMGNLEPYTYGSSPFDSGCELCTGGCSMGLPELLSQLRTRQLRHQEAVSYQWQGS